MLSSQENGDVAIFWDYENCPASTITSGYFLVNQIRTLAHSYGIIKLFKAYVEIDQVKNPAFRAELQSSGVSLTDCPHVGKKDVVDKMMIVDMLAYAMDHPGPRTIMIISGDRDYAYAAAILRLRRYHVVVISSAGQSGSSPFLSAQASVCYDWAADILGKQSTQESPAMNPLRSGKEADPWRASSPLPKLPTPSPEPVRSLTSNIRSRRGTISRVESSSKLAEEIQSASFASTSGTQPTPSRGNSMDSTTYASTSDDKLPLNQHRASTPLSVPTNTRFSDDVVYDPPRPIFESTIPPTPAFPAILRTPHLSGNVQQLPLDSPDFGSRAPGAVPEGGSVTNFKGKEKQTTDGYISFNSHPTTSSSPPATIPSPPPTIPGPDMSVPDSCSPGSAKQTQTPLVLPKAPPAEYLTLVKVLEAHRKAGRAHPTRSVVACEIVSADNSIYGKAGVNKFSQYINLAESKGIVTTGGLNGGAWISLLPQWCNRV